MILREFLRNWSARVDTPAGFRQSGALPYAVVEGRLAILLITSRRTGRWIFPKGAVEPDMTPWDSAAKEAYEEAGVIGEVEREAIGSYRAGAGPTGSTLVDIDIYPLRVVQQLDEWKEKGQRLRHWAVPLEARRLLGDPTLGRLALLLQSRLGAAQGVTSSSTR